jgi:hypothetical protein
MLGAKVDFEASGFVDVKFCPECGNRTDNISETDKRQGTKKYGTIFFAETWNGADLFTTDISDRHFSVRKKLWNVQRSTNIPISDLFLWNGAIR